MQEIFVCMHRDVLLGLLYGDLPQRSRLKESGSLRRALRRNYEQAMIKTLKQPVIYSHFLVNRNNGRPPTYEHMALILEDLAAYPKDAKLAREVDSQIGRDGVKPSIRESQDGFRRYLYKQDRSTLIKDRLTSLTTLHSALSRRLERFAQLPGYDKTACMPYGLSEHGFTIDAATRKAHHAAHENSTAFLSLTDAICRRRFGKEYKMRFYVVCCLPEPWMVGLAEHLITVIGQGYVRNGGGLNYHLAGFEHHRRRKPN